MTTPEMPNSPTGGLPPCDERLESLSRRLDGDLSVAEERELAAHLETCAGCRETWELLRGVAGAAGASARAWVPPPDLVPNVMQRLREEGLVGRRKGKLLLFPTSPLFAAAAATILAVGGALWLTSQGRSPESLLDEGLAKKRAEDRPVKASEAAPGPAAPSPEPIGSMEAAREDAAPATDAPARPPAAEAPRPAAAPRPEVASPPEPRRQAAKSDAALPAESRKGGEKNESPGASGSALSEDRDDDLRSRPVARNFSSVPTLQATEPQVGAAAKETDGVVSGEASAPAREESAPPPSPESEKTREAAASGAGVEGKLERAGARAKRVGAPADAPERDNRPASGKDLADELVPVANWQPDDGTRWDRPPRWTADAERLIARVRGGRVVLVIRFTQDGKVLSGSRLDGDRHRADEILRLVRALDRALVPAERAGVLIAGVGRVEMTAIGM